MADSQNVSGYRKQRPEDVALANINKELEERILRQLDHLATLPEIDKRWLATGRTEIEKGFMAVNRAIFKPERVALPEDQA